ncbi:hypothetical protein HAX54_040600 [Datura stramonium]|uniref:Uncharacterized protein n=1 Tax=Datura stramonium TaxID=4076 RepID=A0ABS8VRW0_DATST|nr:hypothetical protein [Datura stramonium]
MPEVSIRASGYDFSGSCPWGASERANEWERVPCRYVIDGTTIEKGLGEARHAYDKMSRSLPRCGLEIFADDVVLRSLSYVAKILALANYIGYHPKPCLSGVLDSY